MKRTQKRQQPRRAALETIEPRILYAADFSPGLLDSGMSPAEVEQRVLDTGGEFAQTGALDSQLRRHEIVFVDPATPDYAKLIEDMRAQDGARDIEVVLLKSTSDGINQISKNLAGREDISAIHIVSHGTDGSVQLGRTSLNFDSLLKSAGKIKGWGQALSTDADILIYGCNVAQSDAGRSLVDALARLTGADVAASDDLTGASDQRGDWILEYRVGDVDSEIVVSISAQLDWRGTLNTYTVNSTADAGAGSLRQAILDANANTGADTIAFNIGGGGAQTISLSSALPTLSGATNLDATTQSGYSGTPLIRIDGASAGGGANGISVGAGADNSTIRGLAITRFSADGINVASGADNVTIADNWIGTSGTGATLTGNSDDGIDIAGSTAAITGNVVTNSGDEGITIVGSGVTAHQIQGNIIGLDPDGSSGANGRGAGLAGNADVGLAIISGTGNTIGGTSAAARNLISWNLEGIEINTSNNVVQGNYIGTDATGTLNRGNRSGDGVQVQGGSTNNRIGGSAAGAGNLIAYNVGNGVGVDSGSGHSILGNSSYSNTSLGINLGAAGVTGNDPGDGDGGANNLQNFPVLTSANSNAAGTTIVGSLNSNAGTTFRVELFANRPSVADAPNGEGERFLGAITVLTDGAGNATINTTLANVWVNSGDRITATATVDLGGGNYGSTSEFAANVTATSTGIVVVDTTSDVSDGTTTSITNLGAARGADGRISLREAIAATNATANGGTSDKIVFAIPTNSAGYSSARGVFTISAGTALPTVGEALTIDGTSQAAQVGDTNVGMLGAGGTVGVDGLTLSQVARPEIELRDGAAVARGLDINAANVTVRGLAIYGFTDNIYVGDVSGALIEGNVLGTAADSFTDPGAGVRTNSYNVHVVNGDGGILRNNLIGYSALGGARIETGANTWLVENNEFRGNAQTNTLYDGLAIEGTSATVRGNLVINNLGNAIEFFNAGGTHTVVNNTVTGNAGSQGWAVAVNDAVSNVTLDRNQIVSNTGAGIAIVNGTVNTITANSISGNTGLGIDLGSNGVTINDNADADSGGNNVQNFPILSTAVISGGNLTITGFTRPGTAIELFVASPDASGFGEGQTYLTTLTEGSGADTDAGTGTYTNPVNGLNQGTDTTNRFSFTIALPVGVTAGTQLTATGTLAGSTSEFSGNVTVVSASVPVAANDSYSVSEDGVLVVTASSTNLTSWWQFDEGSGQTAADSVAPAADGTLGSTAGADANDPTWTAGRSGTNALSFDGSSNYVTTTSTELRTASAFTISAWFKTDTTTGAHHIVWQGASGGNGFGDPGIVSPASSEMNLSVGTYDQNDKIVFFMGYDVPANGADAIYIVSTRNFTDTAAWHHVAVAVSDVGGGVMSASLYVDGVLEGTDTGSQNDRSQWGNLKLGAPDAAQRYFDGALDEVRLYSTALSAAQIESVARAGVLQNDTDTNQSGLTAVLSTGPTNGALSVNGDGSFTYTPNANFAGTDSFTYWANDGTSNSNVATVTLTVNPINDAPVASGSATLAAVAEDTASPAGALVSTMFAANYSDATDAAQATALSGVAITANAATAGQGTWQYSSNGSTWNNVPTGGLSDSTALVLPSSYYLRFVPAADYNGTPGSLTVRLADASAGAIAFSASSNISAAVGGTGNWSSATVALGTSVSAVNDAPTLAGLTGDALSYMSGSGALVIEQGGDVAVSDVDSADFNTGVLTVSITAGGDITEDVLSVRNQGSGAGQIGFAAGNVSYQGVLIGTAAGGSGGTPLSITFNGNATPTAVSALLNNITYWNTDALTPTTGARTISFVVSDGDGGTSVASSATVTVTANPAPVAANDSYSVNEDGTLSVSWWDTSWQNRKQITFDNTNSAENLADFAVLVRLNPSNIDFAKIKAGGADIRFLDANGAPLAYEIDSWDDTPGSESATVWVRVPQIDAGSTSDFIWIYYNNAAASDAQNATAVWGANYKGVYHLKEDPSAAGAGGIKDSTSNAHNGTDQGGMTSGDQIAGRIGGSLRFNAAAEYVDFGDVNDFDFGLSNFTASFWVKGSAGSDAFLTKSDYSGPYTGVYLYHSNSQNSYSWYGPGYVEFNENGSDAQWHYLVATREGTGANQFKVYTDGVLENTGTLGANLTNNLSFMIHRWADTASTNNVTQIDEVRMLNAGRSAEWIEAEYLSQNGSFAFTNVGGEQSVPAVGGVLDNDSDANGDPLTVTLVSGPSNAASFTLMADGTFTYTPSANFAGTDTFTYRANDGTNNSNLASVTLTVNPINDEPSFTTLGNQSVAEDAAAQTVAGFATPSAGGGADEAGQTFAYTVTNDNNALFAVQPTIAANGTLSYTPTANAFGSATVTVFVTDSGGTANGGDNTSPSQTFTITVGAVADTPSVTNATTNEDTQTTSGLVISRNVADGAEVTHFKITGISDGTLYQNDGTTVIANNSFITFAQANAGLKFTPSANSIANGSFQVQGSTSNVDAGLGGGVATATITVNAVNDQPTTGGIADVTVNEDAAPSVIDLFAAFADVEDADGALTYTLTGNTNAGLFGATTIDGGLGTLTLGYAANASGTSDITVRATDTGGAFVETTFTVVVNAVNDEPNFSLGADQTIAEDAAAQAVNGFAGALPGGGADEAGQTFTYTVSNDNNSLFSVQPTIDASGNLSYTAAANANGSATVTVFVADSGGTANGGDNTSPSQTFTITVNPVADTPGVTNATTNEDTQSALGLVISRNAADGAEVTHFKITGITGGTLYRNDGTTVIANGSFITFAQANAGLKFTPSADSTANGSFQVQASTSNVDAGLGGGVVTATITVNPINDAPVVSAGAATGYTENAVPVVVDNTVTIGDVDDTQITGATVSIGPGFTAGDVLGFVNTASITGVYNAGTGVLTLTGTDTLANYQTALRSVTYRSTSEDPTEVSTTRTIAWQVTDANAQGTGALSSAVVTSTVNVSALADAPVMTAGATTAYTENAAAVVIDNTITVADVDDTQIGSATVSIGAGFTAGDVLGFVNTASITGVYNAGTGVLTLTGADTLANYQAALRSVTYRSTSEDPTATSASRTIGWQVTDANSDAVGPASSVAVTSTVNLTALADAPLVTAGAVTAYTESAAAVAIDSAITISDADDTQIAGATVTISVGLTAGDVLGFVNTASITGVYNAGTGVLTLTGADTLANYQSALRAVTYSSTSEDPTALSATRTVSWQVTDANSDGLGAQSSAVVTSTMNVTSLNDAPLVSAGASIAYTENAAAVTIDNTITVADADDTQIAGATVTISAGLTAGDVLGFVNTASITGSYNAGTGVLTLSGTDTLANYQAALRSVTYVSTSEDPTAVSITRSIDWQVTDADSEGLGAQTSAVATSSLNITAVNDVPVALDDNGATDEDSVLNVAANGVLANDSDVDGGPLTVSAVEGNPADVGNPVLLASGALLTLNADGSFSYDPNGAFDWLAAGETASDSFVYTVSDGNGGSATANVSIDLSGVNDAPSGADGTIVLDEDSAYTFSVPDFGFNDVDVSDNLQGVRIGLGGPGSLTLSGVPVIGWQLVSEADITLGNLVYTPDPDANGVGYASVNFIVYDGIVDALAPNTLTLDVIAINDAPSFTQAGNQSVNEDAGAQSVAGFAAASPGGGADEAGQGLAYTVSNDNNALFLVQPTLDAAGNLTYTAAADANGVATVTVFVSDNGGTANGGVDTSASQVFTLTVNAVNDAPTLAIGANQMAAEDAGAQSVAGFASRAPGGGPDEAGQALSYAVSNDNNALFSVQPTLDAAGNLSYTPAPDAFGVATVTVWVSDSGGTANSGVDTSASQSFTITLNPVNDAPLLGANALTIDQGGSVVLGASILSASDVDTPAGALTFIVSNVMNGRFELTSAPGVAVTTFTQAEVAAGQVRFVHNNSAALPGYDVQVDDGALIIGPFAASVSFNPAPAPPSPPALIPPVPVPAPPPPPPADEVLESEAADKPGASLVDAGFSPGRVPANFNDLSEISVRLAKVEARVARAMLIVPAPEARLNDYTAGQSIQPNVQMFNLLPAELNYTPSTPVDWEVAAAFGEGAQEQMRDELQVLIDSVKFGGMALSVGVVWWASRISAMLGSLLASTPAWRHIDPLPVVGRDEEEEDKWLEPDDRDADANELAVSLVLDGGRTTTREAD